MSFVSASKFLRCIPLLLAVACDPVPAARATAETASAPGRIECEAIAITLRDGEQPIAEMHGFGYFGEERGQPITFFWNGGPGFPSALLHVGFAAPQVADLRGGTGLADNPRTLVDVTDLVYVDPIGTGFSRAIAPTLDESFRGVEVDARTAAQFVVMLLAERGWTERPIYLCGESYAGIRVSAMLAPLREHGFVPAGVILISPLLETRTFDPNPDTEGGALRLVDTVPTIAAVTAAHGKREIEDRRADVDAACEFAHGALLDAVRGGDYIDDLEDAAVRAVLEGIGGKRLLSNLRGLDPYDARFRFRASHWAGMVQGAHERAVRSVLEETFGVDAKPYVMKAVSLSSPWIGDDGESYLESDIRAPRMIAAACASDGGGPRVFVAGGWFDTVTPFAVVRRLARERAFGDCEVELHDYAAGHMIYVDEDAHEALVADLRAWFEGRR